MKKTASKHTFEVNVVITREHGEWVAVALEMNVRGYGATQEEAVADVVQMLRAQVSYAVQMNHPETVWQRADLKYWELWDRARRSSFVAAAADRGDEPAELVARHVPLDLLALKHREEWTARA